MRKTSLKEIMRQKEEFRQRIIELTTQPGKKVAYHFNCPDGMISAVLFKHIFSSKKLTFIPIDYPMFKDKEVMKYLKQADWFAIVDLSPFNEKKIDYFFDHHISNSQEIINAQIHVFDATAPSASSLIAKFFQDKIPNYLKELAEITEITDTASYTTPAPLDIKSDPENYSWEDKIWFLEDACKSTFTLEEHNILINTLAKYGWEGLWKENIPNRIKILRQSRNEAYKIAYEIDLTSFVVLIDDPHHYNTAYIATQLMKRGSTGIAYITVYPQEIKLSFRLSKSLNSDSIEKYRVDLLAESMTGGGHKGAAGAEMKDLNIALEMIEKWVNKVELELRVVDLREG